MMISCTDGDNFVPYGREYMQHHPGDVGLSTSNPSQANIPHLDLLRELDTVSIDSKDWWTIRLSKDGLSEEELYMSGRTAVWSRGAGNPEGTRTVLKSLTCESPIQQVLFATFYTYPDLPVLISEEACVSPDPTGKELPAICIVEKGCLSVYMENGEDYSIPLPFPVFSVWSSNYGIILERLVTPTELARRGEHNQLPVLYSLLHPLDEISPVLQKGGLQSNEGDLSILSTYARDPKLCIVYVCMEPSISICFNQSSSTVSVWKIRRALQEEVSSVLQHGHPGGAVDSPVASLVDNHMSCTISHFASPAGAVANSPIPGPRNRLSLPVQLVTPKGTQTPQSHLASISKAQSPACGRYHLRMGLTPSPLRTLHSPLKPSKSPHLPSESALNYSVVDPEPLFPDLCFEHLWSDFIPAKPSKAFFSEDLLGQKFLCLLLNQLNSLRCYKFGFTNDQSMVVIGNNSTLQAKDAHPLPSLNMMLVVNNLNCLILYSGITQMCHMHIAAVSNAFSSSLLRDTSEFNVSRLQSPLGTPFRRSSLLTSSRPSSSLDVKFETGLSPVVHDRSASESFLIEDPSLPFSSAVVGLRDGTNRKITIEHASGSLLRISLPEIHSSMLVEKAVSALKYILPKDAIIMLLMKWYVARNAPGNGEFTPQSEWHLFSKTFLSLIGYDIDKLSPLVPFESSGLCSPQIATKKFRISESGSDSDWEYLLFSSYHQTFGTVCSETLGLQHVNMACPSKEVTAGVLNTNATLFPHLPGILFALHLVYEELKITMVHWDSCALMIPSLSQMATDLRLNQYLHHYWCDFPSISSFQGLKTQLAAEQSFPNVPGYFTESPPSIFGHLLHLMTRPNPPPFPYIPTVCILTRHLILLYGLASTNCPLHEVLSKGFLHRVSPSGQKPHDPANVSSIAQATHSLEFDNVYSIHEKITLLAYKLKFTTKDIELLCPGISILLMNAQHMCRVFPPLSWPSAAYQLLQRPDLVAHQNEAAVHRMEEKRSEQSKLTLRQKDPYNISVRNLKDEECELSSDANRDEIVKDEDGMESLDSTLLALRFPQDQRVMEVHQMLCSTKPVTVNIPQRPEVSNHDFLEEQERHLFLISVRTMALPLARGMFTLCTHAPVVTEPIFIPNLNLKGRAPPRGTTIEFPNSEVPSDMDLWPLFHNGVSAGLRVAPNCGDVTSTWIAYNKPKSEISTVTHAGFLLSLGLNGHLRKLATISLHDYLTQGHELTCVALLLGMATCHKGTMDMQTTKLLSVHLECLLPPTSTELDVPHSVQVAAILGVGLVYAKTAHRRMSEVLLQEIGRPAGPEMENSVDRESYSLAAGLGLGLVLFGKGADSPAFSDLNIAGELFHYIEGGRKKPLSGAMKEKHKSPSYQIKEGDAVNMNVTSPGATLALGMIYFDTGNVAVAEWMVAPETPYLLDQVRPDFLLLRTLSHGLIMWSQVTPSEEWIDSNVPETLKAHVHRGGSHSTPGIDYESMHQAYYNILAGACMVLGLKYAGSGDREAFRILHKHSKQFINYTKRSVAELAGKSTIESCMNSIVLSLSLVMAGTGDLEVLRIVRYLRSRVGPAFSSVGYGSHLAIHMALGFLFLGGGRFSLGTSHMAIASLIIACFPKFPTHSNDNRYHLQAFRHLYVLASEPRLLVPFDVDSGRLCRAKVTVRFASARNGSPVVVSDMAPYLLPELSKTAEVVIEGDHVNGHFWPVRFSKGSASWEVLDALLKRGNGVALKLKEGRHPYDESSARPLVTMPDHIHRDKAVSWSVKPAVLKELFGFSSMLVGAVIGGLRSLTNTDGSTVVQHSKDIPSDEASMAHTLASVIYECLLLGSPDAINNWINCLQGLKKVALRSRYSGLLLWQIKLIAAAGTFISQLSQHCCAPDHEGSERPMEVEYPDELMSSAQFRSHQTPLITAEEAHSLLKRVEAIVDDWESDVQEELLRYLKGDESQMFSTKTAFFVHLHNLPPMHSIHLNSEADLQQNLKDLQNSNISNAAKTFIGSLLVSSVMR